MIKIGVIGLGSMGKNHARVCAELPDIELVAVADKNKETLQKISKRFDVAAYTNYKDLLSLVDGVIVATPTITHHEIAVGSLTKGKSVLVEKPICEDIGKASELVEIAKREDLILAVGHIERHNPTVKFIKEGVNKKRFGELITLASKRVSNFPGRIRDVGVIFDFGIHDIDVMRYIAGEIKSVYAKAGRFNRKISHEDYANIILNFENDICGFVEVNWLTPMKIRKLFITCSENFVEADYISQSITVSSSLFKQVNKMDLYNIPIQYNINKIALEKREPLKNEIEDFVKAIENNSDPLTKGKDGLMSLKIAYAATQSYKRGEEVTVI